MLTQSRVKELFDYKDGKLFWKVCNSRRTSVGQEAGYTDKDGYRVVGIDGYPYRVHRVIWLWFLGYLPEKNLDHRDRIRDHNEIDNLREVGQVCNLRNTGNRINNKSGVKGVHYYTRYAAWEVNICVNGKTIYLGRHEDFLEAVCHRLAAEQYLGWAGCDSCSPAFCYVSKYLEENNVR